MAKLDEPLKLTLKNFLQSRAQLTFKTSALFEAYTAP